jgi:hypothetical protein
LALLLCSGCATKPVRGGLLLVPATLLNIHSHVDEKGDFSRRQSDESLSLEALRKRLRDVDAGQTTENFDSLTVPRRDRVLFLMERGTIYQQLGDFSRSNRDFLEATALIEKEQAFSVSGAAVSTLIGKESAMVWSGTANDRCLLQAMIAVNSLATGDWEHAGVAARRIAAGLDRAKQDKFHDDPFSRYLAGLGLSVVGDHDNSARQFANASALTAKVMINPTDGQLGEHSGCDAESPSTPYPNELICFVLQGDNVADFGKDGYHQPDHSRAASNCFVELHDGKKFLGKSHLLTNTRQLAFMTDKLKPSAEGRLLATTLGTTAWGLGTGIVFAINTLNHLTPDVVFEKFDTERADLIPYIEFGDIPWSKMQAEMGADTKGLTDIRAVALGSADARNWQTLPREFQILRVPCGASPENLQISVKRSDGSSTNARVLGKSMSRNGNTFFTVCRIPRHQPSADIPQ